MNRRTTTTITKKMLHLGTFLLVTVSVLCILPNACTGQGTSATPDEEDECFHMENIWHNGYTGDLVLRSDESVTDWTAEVTFDNVFDTVSVFNGRDQNCAGKTCTFYSRDWNGQLGTPNQKTLKMGFQIAFQEGAALPQVESLKVNGVEVCGSSISTDEEIDDIEVAYH